MSLLRNRYRSDGVGRRFSRDYAGNSPARGTTPEVLFRELWLTASSAPVTSPRACEPGPATIAITGTDQSISGNRFVCPSNAAAQGVVRTDAGLARLDGLALVLKNFRRTGSISSSGTIGWRNAGTMSATFQGGGINIHSTGLRTNNNGAVGIIAPLLTQDVDYDLALIARSAGVFLLYKLSSATTWTLLFVDDVVNAASLFPSYNYTQTVAQLGPVYALQSWNLPRLYYSPSGVIGTVSHVNPDFVAKLRVQGTGTVALKFRIQDATNYWRIERQASAFKLIETVAGVDQADRASSAITAATNDRIQVAAEGSTIRLWQQPAAGTSIVTPTAYASATNFATSTGMAVTDEANYTELEVFARTQTHLRIPE